MKKKFFCLLILLAGILTQSSQAQNSVPFVLSPLPVIKTIEVAGKVKLTYAEQGNNLAVPVVFLHGFTDSWHSFETVLQHLPRTVHAIAITQRGHGNSDKPLTNYAPADFAADAAALVRELKLGPVVIVGHSMGGAVAQKFAIDYPELTKALVIIGSSAVFTGKKDLVDFNNYVQTLTDPIDKAFIDEFQKSTIVNPVDKSYYDTLVAESAKVPAHVWKAALGALVNTNFTESLKGMTKPTLLVWGDKDNFFTRDDQDHLLSTIKGAQLKVYPGTGHSVQWEEPQKFAADLLQFLKTLNK